MSMAASVGTEERQAAQLFKDTALKSLWSMVFSQVFYLEGNYSLWGPLVANLGKASKI